MRCHLTDPLASQLTRLRQDHFLQDFENGANLIRTDIVNSGCPQTPCPLCLQADARARGELQEFGAERPVCSMSK